ncbi:MAG: butyrate kinase [Candidatus Krumholzibacteriia bacterium]
MPTVLAINPGSTSTKLALFDETGCLRQEEIHHTAEELAATPVLRDQLPARLAATRRFLAAADDPALHAVVGRGGPLRPLEGGCYRVDDAMADDLASARWGEHASLLGGLMARSLGEARGVPALVVDPVSVDELDPVARLSGVPEITRLGRSHALSLKAVSRLAAAELALPLAESRFAAAHMGGGISVAAMRGGRIVDVNDALLGMGPFTPFRAGALPLRGVLDLVYGSGTASSPEGARVPARGQVERHLRAESGLFAYLGTGDLREVEARMDAGDGRASEVWEAMVYQIAKELGAVAAALDLDVHAVILTGGMSRSERLVARLEERVGGLGPFLVYPGEREMEALAAGALRVLAGEEQLRDYARVSDRSPR